MNNKSILRKLSFLRAWNFLAVLCSYYWSRAFGSSRPWGMPVAVSIEPTTSCNLRCPECPSGLRSFSRPTGMLDENLFHQWIDEISKRSIYLTFYFQGEPYLNPKFTDMVNYASSRRLFTATSTNAHYLDEKRADETIRSGLDRLIISLDGITQETYESYRVGGNLEKVLEGTRTIVRRKKELGSKTPEIIFQFLVVKPNEHEVEKAKQLAAELGVNEIVFKTAQIYDHENGHPLIPSDEKYSRYRKGADGKWKVKNSLANHCWKMWHSSVITWDGLVVPCCFDKDATHRMGDLKKESFAVIWNSEAYTNFRQSVLRSRSEIDICKNCSEGTKVWT